MAYFGLYLLVLNFVGREEVGGLWRVIEGTVLVFAAFGILQSLFVPGFAQIVYPEAELYTQWDPQGRRLVSTFLDPNLAGALLVLVLLVQGGRLAFGAPVALWKPLLLFGALGLTLSRSSLVALMAGTGVILLVRGLSRRVLKATGVVSLVLLPLAPFLIGLGLAYNKFDLTDPSLLARFVAWGQAVTVLLDHPLIGVGFNTYGFVQQGYGFGDLAMAAFGLDGGLLFIAVMTGLVGLLLYSGMVGRVLMEATALWRNPSRDPEDRGLGLGVLAATVALLVHSLFLNSLLYPFLMQILWILWGLVAVSYRARLVQEEV
jgi:putative inorganic carbon (HCO3(-)) transporter